ncbi:MAG: hypothetical protein EAZ65_04200 [Verrucomicrobia bacterium]|nr:MAG: hypothetical protein EAZ84_02420 [Verrucomicrobiota bacterium]TAE88570.1 MAG: hypothetical protein EAZ82_04880 [Verrucomicrobiota bacterium]TAF27025.1 MAG: hypothetical protein EAZ71_04195 [Verrucomicrobiota bacterium]TAF42281.1 MAG: hypothetical protein EAZ65_04200 [Verrucomicrobiota bacterium]
MNKPCKPRVKGTPSFRFALESSILLIASATCASAATQYWSGAGTWGTGTNWSNASGGPYTVVWANTTADVAVFEGTAGTVAIATNRNVDQLNFNVTGYSLTAATPVTLTGAGPTGVTLASGVTASIGSNITVQSSTTAQNWTLSSTSKSSVLDVSGTIKNATANNSTITGTTVNVKAGGLLQSNNSLLIGGTAVGADLNLDGGKLEMSNTTGVTNLIVNNTAAITSSSTLTFGAGSELTWANAANTGGIRFGGGSTNALTQLTGTINVNGGVVTTNKIYMGGSYTGGATYTATVNLNGGTLRAAQSQAQFLEGITSAKVQAGGAIFDSNNFNITVAQALVADSASGGLEKKGQGTLSLSGSNTYTGDTLVNNGTLALSSTGGLKFLVGANNVSNKIGGTGTVSIDGLFTFDLTSASTLVNSSWNIVDVANLNESFGANFGIAGFTADGGGLLWNGSANGTNYQFSEATGVLSVVPEPAAAVLGGFGMLTLLRRRRQA